MLLSYEGDVPQKHATKSSDFINTSLSITAIENEEHFLRECFHVLSKLCLRTVPWELLISNTHCNKRFSH